MLKTTLGEIITNLNVKKNYWLCQFSGNDLKYHAVPFDGIVWQSEDFDKKEANKWDKKRTSLLKSRLKN